MIQELDVQKIRKDFPMRRTESDLSGQFCHFPETIQCDPGGYRFL